MLIRFLGFMAMEDDDVKAALRRKMPDVDEKSLDEISVALANTGVVRARWVKRVKREHLAESMPKFLLDFVTEKGMFMSEDEHRLMSAASELVKEAILSQEDVDFAQVRLFVGVQWPSLCEVPPRFVTLDEKKQLWLFGRPVFQHLLSDFLAAETGVMDYHGSVGSGKSHLLAMLANRCLYDFAVGKSNKRLVCLLRMPDLPRLLFSDLRLALLVAFWNESKVQRTIISCRDLEALVKLVGELKTRHKLFFIFDEWNVLDASPGCQSVWETLCVLEAGSRALHGGSARSEAAACTRGQKTRQIQASRGQYDPLSDEELEVFLQKESCIKHDLLQAYTGLVPLYVRIFVACQRDANGDDARLLATFLRAKEVHAMHVAFKIVVRGIRVSAPAHKALGLDLYSRLLAGAAKRDDLIWIQEQRWVIVTSDDRLELISDYAKVLFMRLLETELDIQDLGVIVDKVAVQVIDTASMQITCRFSG